MLITKQILVKELLTSYTVVGDGEHLLLLHGWGSNLNSFESIQSELGKKFKVFAVDFPGFGKSEEPKEIWGCEEYSDWTKEFIRKVNIKYPIVLGHSFGGRVAIVLNSKTTLKLLILTGSAGLILDVNKLKRREKKSNFKNILEKILPGPLYLWLKSKAILIIGSKDYKIANEHMREILKKVIKEDLKHFASIIQIRTLLIWGENDNETPLKIGKAFNQIIKKSELMVMENCGHYAYIDNKIEFLHLIETYLNNVE